MNNDCNNAGSLVYSHKCCYFQNGEHHQNGIEPIKNGDAAVVIAEPEKVEKTPAKEEKEKDESVPEEPKVNGEEEVADVKEDTETKASEDKKDKDKKKEKKDKVKKKFSFRVMSFTRKDKSKPSKEEKNDKSADVSFF